MALITAMMAMLLLTALGSALVLISVTETGISAHAREAARVFHGAEAGLHHAFAIVAGTDDWTALLARTVDDGLADGPPGGIRRLAGRVVDLDARTSMLRCGRLAGCSEDERLRSSEVRPWGENNPAWRLFAWGPLGRLVGADKDGDGAIYVAVWIGDDPDETDGDPSTDEPESTRPAHGAVRLLAQGFGALGARRAIDALVVRETLAAMPETPNADVAASGHRTRMVSWREVR